MNHVIDETHDASATSWVNSANGHREFPIQNLPLGVFGEIHDRSVGPAIRTEAGMGYVFSVYAANALVLFGYSLGVLLWKQRRRL